MKWFLSMFLMFSLPQQSFAADPFACPSTINTWSWLCKNAPNQLGRFIAASTIDGNLLARTLYGESTIAPELALAAFTKLQGATLSDTNKMIAAQPELAQSYIYALRTSRDTEVDGYLTKALHAKHWGSAHRDTFRAAFEDMKTLPDEVVLQIVAQRAIKVEDINGFRLGIAKAQALNMYVGTVDIASECDQFDIARNESRRVVCNALAIRLEQHAETTLELDDAFKVIAETSTSNLARTAALAKAKAWATISDEVMRSLGGFSSHRRRDFLLICLANGEPAGLIEFYRKLPGTKASILSTVQ